MPKGVTKLKTAAAAIKAGKIPRKKGSGSATMREKTVAMKTVLSKEGGGTVMDHMGAAGDAVKLAMLQKLEETDHTHGQGEGNATAQVSLELEKAAIVDQIGGKTPSQIATEYHVHRSFVDNALRRRFGSVERAKGALLGITLENALALQEVAASKIGEFSGPQAVMSAAILTDKALAIEKSIRETPKTIDFGALRRIGDTLRELRAIVPKVSVPDNR